MDYAKIILALIVVLLAVCALAKVLLRLGMGLQFRKISIIATSANWDTLKNIIEGSGIFPEKNIAYIAPESIEKDGKNALKGKSLIVFDYPGSTEEMDRLLRTVLTSKETAAGLIVFAPPQSIPYKPENDLMGDIGKTANAVVTNFRGRLLNDILNLMMTTSMMKKSREFML